MPMTLALTKDEVEALRRIAFTNCTAADVEWALDHYPGAKGKADCFPNPYTMDSLTNSCLQQIANEGPYLPYSFVLRLIEQTWSTELVRRGVTTAVPLLVMAPRGFEAQLAVLKAAIADLVQKLPAAPGPGNIGDPAVFTRLCGIRGELQLAVTSLVLFEALKGIHDALHMLQVLGSKWLDAVPRSEEASPLPLLALLKRVKDVIAQQTATLPPESAASCARCFDATLDAERRITTGDADEIAFACAGLRAMLIRELPLIDADMFVVSRNFPLRQFHGIFADPGARDAAIDLGDTLRRRLMEHALWQATDLRLYAIEQTLVSPTATLISQLYTGLLPWTVSNLRILLDRTTAARVIPALNDTVLRYVIGTDPGAAARGAMSASLDDIRRAFADLRDAARSAFLDADQALKRDFSRLLDLKADLEAILARVPAWCQLVLPT